MTNSTPNFWDFSIELYQRQGVAPACLTLQNSFGLDVNLVLLCFWYGNTAGALPPQTIQKAIEFSLQWRAQVVRPLRQTRQWMKQNPAVTDKLQSGFTLLREDIKSVELAAEKHQQESLQVIVNQENVSDQAKGVEGININLKMLLKELEITDSNDIQAALSVIRESIETD